ncbi:hypothetical protein Tco_0463003 [Tanacetum coccineum]
MALHALRILPLDTSGNSLYLVSFFDWQEMCELRKMIDHYPNRIITAHCLRKFHDKVHSNQAFAEISGDVNLHVRQPIQLLEIVCIETASPFLLTPSKLEGDDIMIFGDAVTVADLKESHGRFSGLAPSRIKRDYVCMETASQYPLTPSKIEGDDVTTICDDVKRPIPRMRPAEALTTIQTMADHSQKWHDGTTSRNIGSSSSNNGLAAVHMRKRFGVDYDGINDFYDPDQCGDSRNNEIRERIIQNLHEEWFKGTSEDEDNNEEIIDYLEQTSYDGFVDLDEEEFNKRRCRLLGMPYIEPLPIIIKQVKITRYSLGPGEVYTKVKVLNIEELPRTRNNIAIIRSNIMDEIFENYEDEMT